MCKLRAGAACAAADEHLAVDAQLAQEPSAGAVRRSASHLRVPPLVALAAHTLRQAVKDIFRAELIAQDIEAVPAAALDLDRADNYILRHQRLVAAAIRLRIYVHSGQHQRNRTQQRQRRSKIFFHFPAPKQ